MKATYSFYIVFQVLRVFFIKIDKIQATDFFYFLMFYIPFTSVDIIFHNFLEFHSTLTKKTFLSQIFLFWRFHSDAHPHPNNSQNQLSVIKFLCRCFFILHWWLNIWIQWTTFETLKLTFEIKFENETLYGVPGIIKQILVWRLIFLHCVKAVCIRSYSGPNFPAFVLNAKRYEVSLRIQSKFGQIRTRITLNTDIFHEELISWSLVVSNSIHKYINSIESCFKCIGIIY